MTLLRMVVRGSDERVKLNERTAKCCRKVGLATTLPYEFATQARPSARADILRVFASLVAEKGYNEASIANVAEPLGLSEAAPHDVLDESTQERLAARDVSTPRVSEHTVGRDPTDAVRGELRQQFAERFHATLHGAAYRHSGRSKMQHDRVSSRPACASTADSNAHGTQATSCPSARICANASRSVGTLPP